MASIEARYLSNYDYYQIIRILILRFFIPISNQIWLDISYKYHIVARIFFLLPCSLIRGFRCGEQIGPHGCLEEKQTVERKEKRCTCKVEHFRDEKAPGNASSANKQRF